MKKARAKQGTPFTKLQGAGNDLLVVHTKDLPKTGKAAFLRKMGHRQLGVGCDQIMEITSLKPLAIQIWNNDGSKSEMCANGARTFLFLAAQEGWVNAKAKQIPLRVSGKDYTGQKLGQTFGFSPGEPRILKLDQLQLAEHSIPFYEVSVGNPHCVVLLHEGKHHWTPPSSFSLKEFGPRLETHARFPNKTNVEFVHPPKVKGNTVEATVEIWERGAGPTLSCGSGAVAVAKVLKELTGKNKVKIRMTQFELQISFEGDQATLSGPCALVAKGWYFG